MTAPEPPPPPPTRVTPHHQGSGSTDTVAFLEGEAAAIGWSIDKLNDDLARNERERDELRDRRANLARAMAEMKVAADILRASGLRSEVRPDGPYVEVTNPPPPEAIR